MMVTINGTALDISGITVGDYLVQNNYSSSRIAVELNGEILPKSKYDLTVLKDGDTVEIVSFVGGG